MIVGIPKEIKNNENRVGMVPGGVRALVADGHTVYVQKNALLMMNSQKLVQRF
jgi:alanine dehydrogenase